MVPQTTIPKARQPSAGTQRLRVNQNDTPQPVDTAGGTQSAHSFLQHSPTPMRAQATNTEPDPSQSAFAHFFFFPDSFCFKEGQKSTSKYCSSFFPVPRSYWQGP